MKKKSVALTMIFILLALIIALGAFFAYASVYYHSTVAVSEVTQADAVDIDIMDNGNIAYVPKEKPVAGLIFYPGAKVEYTAYSSLMTEIANRGILCVLVKMPLNLAVLYENAADGIRELYPDISRWYIGGHSLGGSMASSYAAKHSEDFVGIVLLGSYSTADISTDGLYALTVYGSEDKVLNRSQYDRYSANLPSDYIEHVIIGGCHSYFGTYGEQKSDGVPTITNTQQIELTAKYIEQYVKATD